MKFALTCFLIVSAFASFPAHADTEIPLNAKDFRPEGQAQVDHSEYLIKHVTCGGADYGLIYKSYWGWSMGTKFQGVCAWNKRTSLDLCNGDSSPGAIDCYNKAIDHYGLQDKYPKVHIDDVMVGQPLNQETPTNLDIQKPTVQ